MDDGMDDVALDVFALVGGLAFRCTRVDDWMDDVALDVTFARLLGLALCVLLTIVGHLVLPSVGILVTKTVR